MINFSRIFSLSKMEDDSKEIENITENKEDNRVVKISSIADGTCFIHSILKCYHQDYRNNSNENFRRELAYEVRREFIDLLKEPNSNYPDLESTTKFVKQSFFGKEKIASKETKGQKFSEFIQVAYGFQYLTYPDQMKLYSVQYFDNLKEFYDYIGAYRNYLDEFNKYINVKIPERPKFENLQSKSGDRSSVVLPNLPTELSAYVKDMKKVHNNLSRKVDMTYYILMKKLKTELKLELFNPQNFGVPYVQAHMKGNPLPKGLFSELPYNCYFFTANSGVLSRFAYYPLGMLPGIEQICKILQETRLFLGDTDIIPFIPGMLDLNLIVIDFEKNEIINEYSSEKSDSDKWILITNIDNRHFESCGFKDKDGKIYTLFQKDHPFIQTVLKAKQHKGKIDWNYIDKFFAPKVNYNNYSVANLKKMAEEKGIKVKPNILKGDLVKVLENI